VPLSKDGLCRVRRPALRIKRGCMPVAILKDPVHLRAFDPAVVGNTRIIPMSNQAGQSKPCSPPDLKALGRTFTKETPALGQIPLDEVKGARGRGY